MYPILVKSLNEKERTNAGSQLVQLQKGFYGTHRDHKDLIISMIYKS